MRRTLVASLSDAPSVPTAFLPPPDAPPYAAAHPLLLIHCQGHRSGTLACSCGIPHQHACHSSARAFLPSIPGPSVAPHAGTLPLLIHWRTHRLIHRRPPPRLGTLRLFVPHRRNALIQPGSASHYPRTSPPTTYWPQPPAPALAPALAHPRIPCSIAFHASLPTSRRAVTENFDGIPTR